MDQLTLEFIFFHEDPYHRFKQFLREKKVPLLREDKDVTNVEGYVIVIEDNLDDALNDEIEDFYEEMMRLNERLVSTEAGDAMNIMGLAVTIQDGRSVLAAVDPAVLNKILTVVTQQELGQLVDDIVEAVENPDGRPLCKRD
ncbi:MAG: hypothetical protein QNJ56_07275 [Gammaproteobacteria bacterium]|nr:hypothetical protein [Gammaproteobacteria bacterium]